MIVEDIGSILLKWANNNKRDFPWRLTRDPVKILIAEKLLQQTAAGERVVKAYIHVVENYPTINTLASANEFKLVEIFKELGLPYRAKELITISKFIIDEFNGSVPSTRDALLSIPGVGEYIARAVLSFGYNLDFAVVDTNVSRFLFRFYDLPGKQPQNPARNKQLIDLAQSLLPMEKSKEYNWGVLDLCAKVCVVKKPHCIECPLKNRCAFMINNNSLGD